MGKNSNSLTRFGFRFGRGSTHSARTMMLGELTGLFDYVKCPDATKADYRTAIEEDNCLGKRSGSSRHLTYAHLVELYSLDKAHVLFRALLFFWQRDAKGWPMLALLMTFARDALFRSSAPLILQAPEGSVITRKAMEEYLDSLEPGRFSKATLKSTAQNINATWTQSGHLKGRSRKVRSRACATPGGAAYALLLGYLTGARGQGLFNTDYARLLDCPKEQVVELAEQAARSGWIVFKRVGDVIEVLFPNFITEREQEWLREQG